MNENIKGNDFKLVKDLKSKNVPDEDIARILKLQIDDVKKVRIPLKISDVEKFEIISRYENGEEITAITRDYPFSRNAIYKVIKKNCKMRHAKTKMRPEEVKIARKLAEQGKNYKEIADLLDKPEALIYVKVYDIVAKPQKRLTKEEQEEIKELKRQGVAVEVIAKTYEVNRATIYRVLKR